MHTLFLVFYYDFFFSYCLSRIALSHSKKKKAVWKKRAVVVRQDTKKVFVLKASRRELNCEERLWKEIDSKVMNAISGRAKNVLRKVIYRKVKQVVRILHL